MRKMTGAAREIPDSPPKVSSSPIINAFTVSSSANANIDKFNEINSPRIFKKRVEKNKTFYLLLEKEND